MLASLQMVLTVLVMAYLVQWHHDQIRRNRRSWNDLLVAVSELPRDRFDDVRTLRALFMNAPLFVQLADHAAEHSSDPDTSLLDGLRTDAFQIRLFAFAKTVLRRSNTTT